MSSPDCSSLLCFLFYCWEVWIIWPFRFFNFIVDFMHVASLHVSILWWFLVGTQFLFVCFLNILSSVMQTWFSALSFDLDLTVKILCWLYFYLNLFNSGKSLIFCLKKPELLDQVGQIEVHLFFRSFSVTWESLCRISSGLELLRFSFLSIDVYLL